MMLSSSSTGEAGFSSILGSLLAAAAMEESAVGEPASCRGERDADVVKSMIEEEGPAAESSAPGVAKAPQTSSSDLLDLEPKLS
jgi:hypothetical protein